jgi:hypothetical protein
MTNTLLSRPDALVAYWRASAGDDNPAGPLFSDSYAEHELTASQLVVTNCSFCTGSRTIQCCA